MLKWLNQNEKSKRSHMLPLFRNYRLTDWQTIDLFKTSKPEKASHDFWDLECLRSWGNLEQFLL